MPHAISFERFTLAALLVSSLLAPGQAIASSVDRATPSASAIFAEGFESRHVFHWDVHVGLAPLALTAPTTVPASGWGSLDSLGEGRAAWAYIPSPELASGGTFPSPQQATWEVLVYESPLD